LDEEELAAECKQARDSICEERAPVHSTVGQLDFKDLSESFLYKAFERNISE